MPGLISDERTGPIQLQQTEQDRLRRRLELKASAQNACAVAEIDVKLRRALLRRFSGADEDLQPGERCLYWREVGNRFHTVQWKGPATVVAVQRDPDTGTIDTYWIAHGTVLIRAGRQHVRRLVGQEGLVNGAQRAEQAIAGLRQRRVVRTADLRRINKHTLEELEGEISDGIFDEPSPKKAKTNHPPDQGEQDAPAARPESVRSFSYEPTEPIDDLPKDPAEDPPLPVADPSSGLDLPTDPGLDLPDESRRLIWVCATLKSHNPHSKLKQQQRPPAERQVLDLCLNLFRKMFQSLMVMTVKLLSPPLQLTTPSPNLQCLGHLHNFLDFPLLNADGNMKEVRLHGCDLHCGHWCVIILILKALAIQSVPSIMKRSTSLWSYFRMAVKTQPTFQLDGTMIRKPMRSTLVPQQIFGALKMDFWLETMFGQGIALFIQQIFPCLPRSSRPQMA